MREHIYIQLVIAAKAAGSQLTPECLARCAQEAELVLAGYELHCVQRQEEDARQAKAKKSAAKTEPAS